jgi:hypothetical protein
LIIVLRLESGTLTTALFIHNNLFFDAKFICYFLPTGIFLLCFLCLFSILLNLFLIYIAYFGF